MFAFQIKPFQKVQAHGTRSRYEAGELDKIS